MQHAAAYYLLQATKFKLKWLKNFAGTGANKTFFVSTLPFKKIDQIILSWKIHGCGRVFATAACRKKVHCVLIDNCFWRNIFSAQHAERLLCRSIYLVETAVNSVELLKKFNVAIETMEIFHEPVIWSSRKQPTPSGPYSACIWMSNLINKCNPLID